MKYTKVFFSFIIIVVLVSGFSIGNMRKTVNDNIHSEEEVKLVITDETLNNKSEKKAFLTFDDGPSPEITLEILDILNRNQIKATFFVIGNRVEEYPYIFKELVNHKMSVCIHTYDHDYESIYRSPESYMKDLKKCESVIKTYTNGKVSKFVRMPGGSVKSPKKEPLMKQIRKTVIENEYKYIDWNVTTGDSLGRNIPIDKIMKNVVKEIQGKEYAVILMHDSIHKKTTVQSLQQVIDYLRKEGFSFYSLDELTEEDEKILMKEDIINKRMNKK